MAYEITKVPKTGIRILTLNGVFDTREVLRAMTDRVKKASQEHHGRVYRIIDTRQMDSSFTSTTLRLIEDIRRATTDANEPVVQTFVVGSPRLLDIVKYGGMRVCIFSSLEDAVAQASTEIAYQVISDELSMGPTMNQAGQYARA